MTGLTALVGAGEYLPTMEAVDRRLLAQADGRTPRVVCVPAAAGEEGPASVDRWANMGLEYFRRLGASAECARITDRRSADDAQWARMLAAADLIYFSGGNPLYLHRILAGTRAWEAVETAWARGAVYAGCSAGAMILGAYVPDVRSLDLDIYPAFARLPNCIVVPHFNRLEHFRPGATALVRARLTDAQYALGIDEHTALVGRPGEAWEVWGSGMVSVMTRDKTSEYISGSRLELPSAP